MPSAHLTRQRTLPTFIISCQTIGYYINYLPSSNHQKVDFLLEIMKVKTATRQQQQAHLEYVSYEEAPVGCCGVEDYEYEEREQPAPAKSALKVRNYAFDFYGNPIPPEQQQRRQVAPQPQNSRADSYSEFLAEAPRAPPGRHGNDEDVEAGCMAEFGQFMRLSLCPCTADDQLVDDANEMPSAEQELQLQQMRQMTIEAKTSQAMMMFELQAELADIRRQTDEMEQAYRRDIAREVSAKVMLQAKLQARLIDIMEGRMKAEIELDTLGSGRRLQALPAPQSNNGQGASQANNQLVPVSQPMPLNNTTAVVVMEQVKADPPTMPKDPSAQSNVAPSPTVLTSIPKTYSPVRGISSKTTPFGMSIVVEGHQENADAPDATVVDCTQSEVLSPTAMRSFSPKSRDPDGLASYETASTEGCVAHPTPVVALE